MKKATKSTKFKVITSSITATFLLGIAAPIPLHAKEATKLESASSSQMTDEDAKALEEARKALEEHGITAEDIARGIEAELPRDVQSTAATGTVTTMGVKTKAAKEAAQLMLKKLKRIGQVAWDRTISTYINKLPIPKAAKTFMKKYLKYQFVMTTLNTVIGFSGTIIAGLSSSLQDAGMPKWLADMSARALVNILL
ncbi:hypothetical protein U8V72_15200 [Priestia filamentosa]|uniref:hypothetical protein n=1 Tax=Priestia filamentosa TaxID=1402861 RepID=UPI00397C746A